MVFSSLDKEQDVVLTFDLFHLLQKIIGIFDRFPVDLSDDIPGLNTRLVGRAPGFNLSHYHTPGFF